MAENQPIQKPPRMNRIPRRRHQKPVTHQVFLQQPANAFVIVNDQQMRIDVIHAPFSRRAWYLRRISGSIIASNTWRNPATACGPAAR